MAKRNTVTDARKTLIKDKDAEFIMQVYSDYDASKELKPVDDWQKFDDYVEDDQWDAPDAKDEWKPRPQINVCWKTLRSIHANMTSGKTSINVNANYPYYDDIVQKVNNTVEYYWQALDMEEQVSEAEWIRPKIGTIILKAPWNPKKNNGKGDLDTDVVHPANCFPDPNITNPRKIQQAEFIDLVHPKTIKYVLNNYSKENDPLCKYTRKELEQIIIPESDFSDTEIFGDDVTTANTEVPSTLVGTDKVARTLNHRDRVKLHEYWYRDDNNKLQVAWIAGQVLLKHTIDDEEIRKNGFYKHGKYPIVIIPYVKKDKRLWGRSEMQSLVARDNKKDGIQDIINILIQDYLVIHKTVGQPQRAYRHGAIKDPKAWTGEPDMKIPTKGNPRQDIYEMRGTPAPHLLQAVESFLTHADRITNLWDVTQGRSTPYTKTAGGTLALLEQAMKPQTDIIMAMNRGLRELAEIWLEQLAEFVTVDREYVLQKGDTMNVFEFNPSIILAAPNRLKAENERGYVEEPGETRRLYFAVNIDVGASLALTKAYLIELAMNLWQQKAIDQKGLYKLLPEWPGKQETLERMMAMQQQAQLAQSGASPEEQQIAAFLQSLPPEVLAQLEALPPEQQMQQIMEMMQNPGEQGPGITGMMGGGAYGEQEFVQNLQG